jgi:hypothetical protein
MSYHRFYDLWLARLRAGTIGENPDKPSTWKYDALWSAACCERQAEDAGRAGLYGARDEWMRRAVEMMREVDQSTLPPSARKLRMVP